VNQTWAAPAAIDTTKAPLHLPGSGKRPYPRPDVNSDAPDSVSIKFHFARVHASADLYPQVVDR
jgi:hypothetical protein